MNTDITSSNPESAQGSKAIWVFTPSRTDPKDLEFILVQRHELLKDAVERVKESALTEHKHHLLFVGPRGCGKTHLVTLIVSRLGTDDTLANKLRIAWLNEDETCTTLLDFLLKIHSALEKRHPQEYQAKALEDAFEMTSKSALEFVSKHLLSTLGSRTLLVVTENLDAIFEGLGDSGQKQLRAFIQENPKLSIVATAQRLVEDLSDRASPFFGFFQTEHLKPLNVEQATDLLQNIAKLQGKHDLVKFLSTSRGYSRVRALHHLSGGNHRIYIVLSQFVTRDSIDALVGPFMKMIDELTPYYQERIRWLPTQQRKIMEYLCSCETTVPVKEIAKKLFATPQTISSQLQELREKGYVEANQRGRESLYEVSEPLMRICVEVKENQSQKPIRLLVDFLRVWYEENELKLRLGALAPDSPSCLYLEVAIRKNDAEGNLRKALIIRELQDWLPRTISSKERQMHVQNLGNSSEAVLLALDSWRKGDTTKAIQHCSENLIQDLSSEDRCQLLYIRSGLYSTIGTPQEQVADLTSIIHTEDVSPGLRSMALLRRGTAYDSANSMDLAVKDYTDVIQLNGSPTPTILEALINRGLNLSIMGDLQRAMEDFNTIIATEGSTAENMAYALLGRGLIYRSKNDVQNAIDDLTSVIQIPDAPIVATAHALLYRATIYRRNGQGEQATADYTRLIKLHEAPDDSVADALLNRGLLRLQEHDIDGALIDCTTIIDSTKAPSKTIAKALALRGLVYSVKGLNIEAQADFEAATRLPEVSGEVIVSAFFALGKLHFREGRWTDGFVALQSGLEKGAAEQPPYHESATNLIHVIFTAGLSPSGRFDRIKELLYLYHKYGALAILGEAIVQHVGSIWRTGEPFPSTDNLEGWISAWERATPDIPGLRLPVRLLRTGINFIKTGGKDEGVLLDLTSAEREIILQAFRLKK
jgi:tetratricopeptide (TPR) repeat protein